MKLTYKYYKDILEEALLRKYQIINCMDYFEGNYNKKGKLLVLRHDVDNHPQRALKMAEIECSLEIKSTYFFRSTNNYYNILDYRTFHIINQIKDMGHEIGYHAEPVDFGKAMNIPYTKAFNIGKKSLELVIDEIIYGVASHREETGNNNLYEFLKSLDYKKMEVKYEAYDDKLNLFEKSTYNTDSYEFYWRNFKNGELTSLKTSLKDLIVSEEKIIYSLTHPNLWYEKHYHE